MSLKRLTIIVAALALLPAAASAQVGIRIGGGGIGLGFIAPPLMGRDRPERVERQRAPQRTERVRRKQNDDDDVKTVKKAPAQEPKEAEAPKVADTPKVTEAQNENSTVSIAVPGANKGEVTTAATEKINSPVDNENSTITGAASSTIEPDPVKAPVTTADTAADGKAVGNCRRYIPTAGQTITVPCD